MIQIAILEEDPGLGERITGLLMKMPGIQASVQVFPSGGSFIQSPDPAPGDFDIAFINTGLEQNSGIRTAEEVNLINPRLQIIFISRDLRSVSPVYDVKHAYFLYIPELENYIAAAVEKAVSALDVFDKKILTVSWNREIFHIFENKIIYMERTLRTTTIHTAGGEFLTSAKLSDLIHKLGDSFILCHRSFIVNLEYVTTFQSAQLFLSNGKVIPVSRPHAKELYTRIEKFLSRAF